MNKVVLFKDDCLYNFAKIEDSNLIVHSDINDEKSGYKSEIELVLDKPNFTKLLDSDEFNVRKDISEENYGEILNNIKEKITTTGEIIKIMDANNIKYTRNVLY